MILSSENLATELIGKAVEIRAQRLYSYVRRWGIFGISQCNAGFMNELTFVAAEFICVNMSNDLDGLLK